MSESRPDGSPRVALVTGASRGVGRAAALAFAKSGAHVVALARTQGALEELDDEIRALRPAEPEATNSCSDGFARLRRHRPAGRGAFSPVGPARRLRRQRRRSGSPDSSPPPRSEDMGRRDGCQRDRQLAAHPVARSAAAPLRRGARRFHNIGRLEPGRAGAYWGPYATSKAALDALARTYAAETLNTSNIRVMLINPGPLRTRMRATAMPGEDPLTLRAPEELAPKIVEICSPDWTETGKLYDFPADRVLSFKSPA